MQKGKPSIYVLTLFFGINQGCHKKNSNWSISWLNINRCSRVCDNYLPVFVTAAWLIFSVKHFIRSFYNGCRSAIIFQASFYLGLLFGMTTLTACGRENTTSLQKELDYLIKNKQLFDEKKEERIDELRRMLRTNGLTPDQEYRINSRLHDEFEKYQLDSAIHYVERNLKLGHQMDSDRYVLCAKLALTRLYASTGRTIESKHILDSIDRRSVPRDLLPVYYWTFNLFFYHYAVLSNQRKAPEAKLYSDSLMMVADTASARYKLELPSRLEPDSVETYLLQLLKEIGPDDIHHAEVAGQLGGLYRRRGDMERSKHYYMLSAATDVRHSIKENTSFQLLASIYYDEGNFAQAFKYTQAAIEDALFSSVQFRTVQVSELYSIISVSHQAKEARIRYKLQHYLLLISVLSVVLILLFVFVYKQVRKLSRVRKELSGTNAELARLNIELNEINEQLSDANAIKMQYIARFFDICSMYIDKMDNYRKSLKKMAQDRKFEELYKQLKSTSMLEEEQEELYKNFDAIFLNLYPTFIKDFNALLTEDERIAPKHGDLLNKELRIYALLRLGITDSVKIASFLRCSLSTVYNYRTKVRNKTAISREEFEKMVTKIGTAHKMDW